ncbi:hypothetical protein DMA12_00215 [Amycolatopsis balhimycina DSM 5908]|uniref:ABC transporter ATP-binding protein n=1 Tax=Amycolatopsis balhimycina DSM 5908 TaxID=1081091 RepID=A0A428X5Q3_AMYBA|nr:hypothetical protein [Amycolatopsis balhimycina]RSM50629.1 hypothetical protein DMA12_00215 [Amycolatopsis balhimycina DSM 5908]
MTEPAAVRCTGRIRTLGTPAELEADLGPESTLDDVFRAVTGNRLGNEEGGIRGVRATHRTARRLG